MTTRVVLADDAALVRTAIGVLLRQHGFDVVAEVGDRPALWDAVASARPDVAVVDVRMPPTNRLEGLEAAIDIRATYPAVGVLVLSQYLESRYLTTLLGDSARGVGYLLKERVGGAADFVDAVRRVAAGGCAVDPEVVSLMLAGRRSDDPLQRLTAREREVLALMAEGTLQPGDRRPALSDPQDGGVARAQHLPAPGPPARAGKPPARARGARLPATRRAYPARSRLLSACAVSADLVRNPAAPQPSSFVP